MVCKNGKTLEIGKSLWILDTYGNEISQRNIQEILFRL